MSTAHHMQAEPDFLSAVGPFTPDERYEFLAGLKDLWNHWPATDDRWLIVRQLIWAIDDQASPHSLDIEIPTPYNARLSGALLATVEAVADLHNRDIRDVTPEWTEGVRASASTLIAIADEADRLIGA